MKCRDFRMFKAESRGNSDLIFIFVGGLANLVDSFFLLVRLVEQPLGFGKKGEYLNWNAELLYVVNLLERNLELVLDYMPAVPSRIVVVARITREQVQSAGDDLVERQHRDVVRFHPELLDYILVAL